VLRFLSQPSGRLRRTQRILFAILVGLAGLPLQTAAQAPLRSVNSETTVESVSFRFVNSATFDPNRLQDQIATTAPGILTRLRNLVSFLPGLERRQFFFDPVTLQKDVVRLRQFYRQNGFPNPKIDYPASQLDTSDNRIQVIFTVREGPSLDIRDTDVLNADGTAPAATALDEEVREDWRSFRDDKLQIGGRFTNFEQTQLADEIQRWFRNRGYAFAQVESTASVDTTQYAADLQFRVDPGPRGVISEVQIEGNESIAAPIVLRNLPFSVGDRFSATDVTDGQQELFDLNLFRVAIADVPDQPRDSTVAVRYQVRESRLRSLSGQVGYDTRSGFTLEGSWQHRNFYGNARTFSTNFTADTGLPENPPDFLPGFLTRASSQEVSRQFRASVTLRQPYVFSSRLSGSLAPFVQERLNPALSPNPDRVLSLNERQYGLNSTLVFDVLPYRTLSLQHSVSRTRQFLTTATGDTVRSEAPLAADEDLFNKSVFTLSGTFGDADDFVNPTRGVIVQPSLKVGGFFFESGVEFVRLNTQVSGYLPVSDYVELAGRVSAGSLWPFDESRANLIPPDTPTEETQQRNRIFQNRFSDNLFYGGGGSDVRGWAPQLGGGKVLRKSTVLQEGFSYRPIGARAKIGVNLEARFPLPGLGSNWRTGAFVDGAYLTPGPFNLIPPASVPDIVTDAGGTPISTDPSQLLVGAGAGLRYQTPFGFLRIDLAYKLTPDDLDLRTAEEVGRAVTGNDRPPPVSEIESSTLRRFRVHFGIGRAF
jgi:outer membrane protein insertion porin family